MESLLDTRYGTITRRLVEVRDVQEHIVPVLAMFSRRRYFKRRWVLQEIYNARSANVYCGSSTIAWAELQFAFKEFFETWEIHPESECYINNIPAVYGRVHYEEKAAALSRWMDPMVYRDADRDNSACSLIQRLIWFEDAECSNTKDRVYSLLEFGKGKTVLEVDYALTSITLWKQVARVLVQEGFANAAIDLSAGQDAVLNLNLQSWVPDLGSHLMIHHNQNFQSRRDNNATVDCEDRLHITMYCLGTVLSAGAGNRLLTFDGSSREIILGFSPRIRQGPERPSLNEGDFLVSTVEVDSDATAIVLRPVRPVDSRTLIGHEEEISCTVVGTVSLLRVKEPRIGHYRRFCLV